MEKIELSPRQQKVLSTLKRSGKIKIADLARKAFPGVRPLTKANSWVRNQLRGLVAHKLAKKIDKGTYQARA